MNFRRVQFATLFAFVLLVLFGYGAWMVRSAEPPGEKVLFEEGFTDAPGNGWSWHGEIPDHWKIDKEHKELLIRPVWGMRNLLLRTPPDIKEGSIAIDVHLNHVPRTDFEAAGLLWFFDDKNYMAIQKERVGDGKMEVFLMRRKAGKPESPTVVTYNKPEIDLRMVVTGLKAQGWYRASDADKWESLGELEMPTSGAAMVGVRTSNGEEDKPAWARFSKFRILQVER